MLDGPPEQNVRKGTRNAIMPLFMVKCLQYNENIVKGDIDWGAASVCETAAMTSASLGGAPDVETAI